MTNTLASVRQLAIATLMLTTPITLSAQIFDGKVNDFEDGTTQGWMINLLGQGAPATVPTNVGTGGPAGVNDNYLQLTSIGQQTAGGRLTALNTGWSGDWLAAGITHFRFDAINLGNTDLTLRLLVEDPTIGPPSNIAASATGLVLAAGSGWQSLEFTMSGPDGLAALLGNVDDALSNVTVIRIFHSPNFIFPGEPSVSQLGIDNITARVVPEPSSVVLFGAGALGLYFVRRRARRF